MARKRGKYEKIRDNPQWNCPYAMVPLWFFLVEVFAFTYLKTTGADRDCWPLVFGALWAVGISGVLYMIPGRFSGVLFGILAILSMVYSLGQTCYYLLFSEMMWLTEFRYVSEGANYASVLRNYPISWFLWTGVLLGMGVLLAVRYPRYTIRPVTQLIAVTVVAVCAAAAVRLPAVVFLEDENIRYSGNDYGRAQSAEAAYENMFNTHRLYQVCGLYQTLTKDIYTHHIYPLTPEYAQEREQAQAVVDAYFAQKPMAEPNAMTGLLEGRHVVLVLMESMDDWMIGEHTPTISRLMSEGICFTNFYTPPYGGIRTFNTEFCINTGSFLSSQGGYAFDYVTNAYDHSLANLLTGAGYSAKYFHYNTPTFYSRNVFSEAFGYEDYVCYADYLTGVDEKTKKQLLYDDTLVFAEERLREEFFRDEEKLFNFVITRSAHLSYKYNEVLSHWALKQYPEYKGLTDSEETDCALVKARVVDDFFRELLAGLDREGKLNDTVIIGITDHYTYGYKNVAELLDLSNVDSTLLLEKTPCFIWAVDLRPTVVEKPLNTADLLPTVLNLLGISTNTQYLGRDAFDETYLGFVPFSNGSWITEDMAYDASAGQYIPLRPGDPQQSLQSGKDISRKAQSFISINNLILESDYYNKR